MVGCPTGGFELVVDGGDLDINIHRTATDGVRLGQDAAVGVEEAVEGLCAPREGIQGTLEVLSGGVEQAPAVAILGKLRVPGIAPLVQDARNLGHGAGTGVEHADHQVVGFRVREFIFLVGGDAGVHVVPALGQAAHGTDGETGEVVHDVSGVLAGDFDLAGKGEVVADEHRRSHDEASREHLVVAVAEAEHVGVVFGLIAVGDLEQAEVAVTTLGQGVGLIDDPHVRGGEGLLDLADEGVVRDGVPGVGGGWCADGGDLFTGDSSGTAVEDEVGGFHFVFGSVFLNSVLLLWYYCIRIGHSVNSFFKFFNVFISLNTSHLRDFIKLYATE